MLSYEALINKSLPKLNGLNPIVRNKTKQLITNCSGSRGVLILITDGFRSFQEQADKYAQGRTKSGSIVTNAQAGHSYHNYGLAVDFVLLSQDGNNVYYDIKRDGDNDRQADWDEVIEEAKKLGFEHGIKLNKNTIDYPHLQMTFGLSISALLNGRKPPNG